MLDSFPAGYRALVIGSSGAIGGALLDALRADPDCAVAIGLNRRSDPMIDFDQEDSIGVAARQLSASGPFQLIVNAAGVLHSERFMPEKKLGDLAYEQFLATFRANAFGPALVLRHFAPLLDRKRSVLALLSAKVGSIGDNRLGGWYSYRASKAALNMLVKTAAIELARTRPNTCVVALHPGTVDSGLSRPFSGARIGRPAADAAADLLEVIDRLEASASGGFFSYNGEALPW
jgi:NAD(P)-dependent dehydrogenase (short-subunit alcohol dehydrogenase family)